MNCCEYAPLGDGYDAVITVDVARIMFGRRSIGELGPRARAWRHPGGTVHRQRRGTAARRRRCPGFPEGGRTGRGDLPDVRVEPTDESFLDVARFVAQAKPDGYVSVGGGSVIGTAIFDLLSMAATTGIAAPALRPAEALTDPDSTDSLPAEVLAGSGLDVPALGYW